MTEEIIEISNHNERSKRAGFEDAITLTGYGKFNLQILFASGGCLMVVIIETMAMMMIVPSSQCDMDLDLTTKGLLNAISFLGVVTSSYIWGFYADTKGRRNILIISMATSFITSLLSSIIPWVWLFISIRFLNGFAVGGASAVVYAYVGEFHDRIYRPKVVSWLATFVAFGNIVIPGFAWLILPMEWSQEVPILDINFRPWRLLIICYGTPSILFAIWLLFLPESPKYLMSQGRLKESLEILKLMYSQNTGKPKEDFPITELVADEEVASNNVNKESNIFKQMWHQTIPLFKRQYIAKTFMVSVLQFTAFASSSGLLMWFPEILNMMSNYAEAYDSESFMLCNAIDHHNNVTSQQMFSTETTCDDVIDGDVYFIGVLVGVTFAAMYILIGIVINAIGAKNLLLIFLIITTSCGLAAQNVSGYGPIEGLIGIFLTEATCVGVINAIVVELFPTHLRAMALAISLMAGRLGAVAGTNLTGPLIYNLCDYMFYFFALDHLIITVLLLPSPRSIKKMIDVKV